MCCVSLLLTTHTHRLTFMLRNVSATLSSMVNVAWHRQGWRVCGRLSDHALVSDDTLQQYTTTVSIYMSSCLLLLEARYIFVVNASMCYQWLHINVPVAVWTVPSLTAFNQQLNTFLYRWSFGDYWVDPALSPAVVTLCGTVVVPQSSVTVSSIIVSDSITLITIFNNI